MKIKVTQEDIELGLCYDGHECPVARAYKRLFPAHVVAVDHTSSIFNGEHYVNSKEAVAFIKAFDNRELVAPGEFDFEPRE